MSKNKTEQMEQLDIRDICQGKLCKAFFDEIKKYFNLKNMDVHLVYIPSKNKHDLFNWVWAGYLSNGTIDPDWKQKEEEMWKKLNESKDKLEISIKEKGTFEVEQMSMIFTCHIEDGALIYGNNLTVNSEEKYKELTLNVLF